MSPQQSSNKPVESVDEPLPVEIASPEPKMVVLRVTDPWRTSFEIGSEDGDTLVIDQRGVEVPAADAERIKDIAGKHGVTITEVSN